MSRYKYTEDNPLKVFTAFSGYDSQCLALDRIGIPYELVGWSEIDDNAIRGHNALYPQYADRNYGDIQKINWKQVPDFDLFTFSSPCFVAGTLIHTEEGYKPIEDVKVGDKVLSHDNRYYAVEKTGHKPSTDMYRVVGSMFDEIICTGEHPFYTRERYRYGHKGIRAFREPKWVNAQDLNNNLYLGYAINTKSELPHWEGSIDNRWGHHRKVNNLQPVLDNPMFWYLMGRYVGDGWKKISKNGNGIIICCSSRNEDSLLNAINELGWKAYKAEEKTVLKYTICSNELCSFVDRYGYYAHGKQIDEETMALPTELLKSFVQGVFDSDGCYTNNEYKITSVSRTLVYGLQQCIAKVYHRPVKMYKCKRPSKYVIEGRVVNQRDTYTIVWHDPKKQDKAFYEDGYVWFPLQKIEKLDESDIVYNIQVAESHSYTANGAIVHNCQDWSAAGLQRGGAEGSGTRSSLLWECRKAILEKKPRYLLLENVKALVCKKFIPYFNKWLSELEGYGYTNYWKIMNAKDYGVPQNRERVFCVSVLGDHDIYHFPLPQELELRLKDILEPEVDDKYVLSDTAIEGFLKHNLNHLAKGTGFLFKPKEVDLPETEGGGHQVANCLRARAALNATDNTIKERIRQYPTPCRQDREEEQRICTSSKGNGK